MQLFCILWLMSLSDSVRAMEDPFAEPSLRIGFYAESFPEISQEDIRISIKLLSEELGRDAGIDTTVKVYEDIRVMRNDFEQGKINFVISSSLSLVTDFDYQLFADGFRLVASNEAQDQVVVLAQKKSGKTRFKEFKNKRLILGELDPMTELVVDYLAWISFKQGYRSSFKEVPREKKAHQLILKLFFDQADITCVYNKSYQLAAELNPQIADQLQVIDHIDGIPHGSGLFHIKTPPAFRERVIEQALILATNPRGQQLLQIFKADTVTRITANILLPIKNIHDAWRRMAES